MRFKEGRLLSLNNDVANATDTGSIVTSDSSDATSEALLARILTSLDEDKAEDVVQIDLRGKTAIGDYMVIASGRSTRQVAAMSEKLVDRIKKDYGFTAKIEGKGAGDWVLIDAGDVIVHLFRPEVREFYGLEKLWAETPAQEAAAAPL